MRCHCGCVELLGWTGGGVGELGGEQEATEETEGTCVFQGSYSLRSPPIHENPFLLRPSQPPSLPWGWPASPISYCPSSCVPPTSLPLSGVTTSCTLASTTPQHCFGGESVWKYQLVELAIEFVSSCRPERLVILKGLVSTSMYTMSYTNFGCVRVITKFLTKVVDVC